MSNRRLNQQGRDSNSKENRSHDSRRRDDRDSRNRGDNHKRYECRDDGIGRGGREDPWETPHGFGSFHSNGVFASDENLNSSKRGKLDQRVSKNNIN